MFWDRHEKDGQHFTLKSPLPVPTADIPNTSQLSSPLNLEILNLVLQEAINN